MISRVYLKDYLSFEEVDLEFGTGLNIFTGPSGAGKSIFMQAILSLFGLVDSKVNIGEVTISDAKIEADAFGLGLEDDIVIKCIKKDKVRYFLNNQTISKKALFDFSTRLIKHLSLRSSSEFESEKLIDFLDRLAIKKEVEFKEIKNSFDSLYIELSEVKKSLSKIKEDESKLEDLKEFAKFEIKKIEEINPSIDE